MLSFATTIDNIRQRLEHRHDVLTLLSKTPFWTLIEAYIQKRITKVKCMKSNSDIVRLIQVYDTKTKKFKFNDGDSEMKSQDVAEIFGLSNRGKNLNKARFAFCKKILQEQMTLAAVKWSLQELSVKLHHLKNNQIKIKSTKAQGPDDAAEEVNEENDDDAKEENEEEDDAAEEVNEDHDNAAEEENEEKDDATE
ncbi:hypothetical protein L3X38_042750 [Prunus dulcis]|uniref:Uncharacterized protein n=1 Tax=Prunus dulcis TaxID=3755 RepID=A0AAD4UVJ4_PRUDU|nr:hypothetical protein L3X38_042750 [Prunus dulcis]